MSLFLCRSLRLSSNNIGPAGAQVPWLWRFSVSDLFRCALFEALALGFFPQDASDASSPHPGLQTGMAEEGMRIFCEVANLA